MKPRGRRPVLATVATSIVLASLAAVLPAAATPNGVEVELQRLEDLLDHDPSQVLEELPALMDRVDPARPLYLRCLRLRVEAGMAAGLTDELLEWCEEGLGAVPAEGGDPATRVLLLLGKATVLEHRGQYVEAHDLVDAAHALAHELGQRAVIARVLQARGEVHVRTGDHAAALESLLEAFELYQELGDRQAMSDVYSAVAVTYGNLGDHEHELEYQQKSLALIDAERQPMDASIAHYNIGLALRSLERYDEAVESFTTALELSRSLDDTIGVAYAEARLAAIAGNRGDRARAFDLYDRAISIFAEHGYAQMEFVCLTDRARLRSIAGQPSLAFSDLERAAELAALLDTPKRWAELSARRAEALAANGAYREAYEEILRREEHLTEVHRSERERQLNEMEVHFKTSQKEAENRLLTQELELRRVREAEARLRTNLILTLLALAVAALATALLLVRRRHLHRQTEIMRERATELERVVTERTADLNRYATALESRSEALRQANDRISAADQQKSAFLASMSHELRTPLNSIIGFAEVLTKVAGDDPDPKLLRFREIILSSAHHLLSLINNILDLSKIEAGRMEVTPVRTQVEGIIEGVIEVMAGFCHGRGVAISPRLHTDLPTMVTDEARLKQILFNLLSNAVKYSSERGSVELAVAPVGADDSEIGGAAVRFEVIDHGEGIAADDLREIFEPFRQAGLPQRRAGGTGLGLALVKELCELLGGRIELSSTVGVGTRAVVVLPVEIKRGTTENGGGDHQAAPVVDSVLVVENRAEPFRRLAAVLEGHGLLPVRAHDPGEALHRAAQLRPGLAVIDLDLPRALGWEALLALASDPVTRQRPALLVASDGADAVVAAELDAVLAAPVEPESLLWRLEGLLGSPLAVPKARVLLVGDDSQMAELVERLRSSVAELWVVSDQEQSREVLDHSRVDVVILDLLHRPEVGLDVERRLRRDEGDPGPPVVALVSRELPPRLRTALERSAAAAGGLPGSSLGGALTRVIARTQRTGSAPAARPSTAPPHVTAGD